MDNIRVLWFTNTGANSDEYFNSKLIGSGGWIKELDQIIQDKIELHVAFFSDFDNCFKYKNTTYHPLKINNSIFQRVKNRLFSFTNLEKEREQYLNILDRVSPDLIHIHGTENSFSTIISKTNIPIVVSIQGNIKMIVKNYCNGIEKKYLDFKDRKVASLKDLLFPWTFRVEFSTFSKIQKLETESLAKAKYIMGRTEWDKRITRILAPSSQYFHEDRILRKPFYAAKWMPEKRDILIVHTTNGNTFYKGFETICLTVYYLNKVGISFEWRVAGISENDLIVKIVKKQLKDKYPKSGLVLLGNLDENKLLSCMLQSDLYVMSSHIENNANNLYEAMIIGMPCISTFVGGIGSLIQDGITGVLIQAGDPLAMAGAVLELADNKDKALFLGNNARNAGLIRHDKMRIASDLINSYRQILHSKTSY